MMYLLMLWSWSGDNYNEYSNYTWDIVRIAAASTVRFKVGEIYNAN